MAKHVLYGDITSTAKQPYLKQTHQHYNEMFNELSKAFGDAIVSETINTVTILWGCENTGTGTSAGDSAIISAGAVYVNGEVYQVPAFSSAQLSYGLKGTFTYAYSAIDPVLFSDNTTHNVHLISTLVLSDDVVGANSDYINWKSIKNKWKTYVLTDSDVGSSAGTFTVSGAGNKLLLYNIDYKNRIVTLNINITNADCTANVDAFYIKLPESLNISNVFTSMGYYKNSYSTAIETSGFTKESVTKMFTGSVYNGNYRYLSIIPSRASFNKFDTDNSNNIFLSGQITFTF